MKRKVDEDRDTIKKVLKGDFDAFEQLVEKYEGRIFRHLRKMVKDNQLAEDLLQETFLNAYKGLDKFSGASSFSTWLFRIATNNALMYLRKKRPETLEYDDEIGTDLEYSGMTVSPDFINTPLDILLSEEGKKKIEEAIECLPLIYRTVIILRDVEGFSLEEVSKIMDSTVAAVKSRLHRARHAVRESLMYYFDDRDLSAMKANS